MQWPFCALVLAAALGGVATGAEVLHRQELRGHVSPAWFGHHGGARLAPTNRLDLTLSLPLRNREALTNLLQDLYRPGSSGTRRYLSAGEFAERFGPTEQDYDELIRFAESHGLRVIRRHSNRTLLRVQGAVGDVEAALHLEIHTFAHPSEERRFFAPSEEPSLDLHARVLHVSGLDDFTRPRPRLARMDARSSRLAVSRAGSGPSGSLLGYDFRKAYVPDTPLTGTGQSVGLFELDGYYASDITAYRTLAGLPNVPLQNVLVDGFSGNPSSRRPGSANEEVALDIEMAMSMAPGLARVLVYEGSPSSTLAQVNDLLNRMATDNLARQLSCSWGFDVDVTSEQIFLQYAAQGQSFLLASGDSGAFAGAVDQPSDNPSLTVVGGTQLTIGTDGSWADEVVWSGSGGGISTVHPLPFWQQGIDFSASHGSPMHRNLPDVAMVADNVWVTADRGQSFAVVGTSIAAPLWAGFAALVNQEAAARGRPPVGFLNPALYRIGKSPGFSAAFHDISSGDNANDAGTASFPAVGGYDLCTGWGSPRGAALIEALLQDPEDPLRITSPLGSLFLGPVGGPFKPTSQTFALTNESSVPLPWSVLGDAPWLSLSKKYGVLAPGTGVDSVVVSLNATASHLLIGDYTASFTFSNAAAGTLQDREFKLSVGDGGFESGAFTYWTFAGQTANTYPDPLDRSAYGGDSIPGLDDSAFVHSGLYGVFLGQNTTLGTLGQTVPTTPGQRYLLTFSLTNPLNGNPNEFRVNWNGGAVFGLVNSPSFPWTDERMILTASATSTLLQFAFRNDDYAFGLDDVRLQALEIPALEDVLVTADGVSIGWNAVVGAPYQLEYTDDLASPAWASLGDPLMAQRVAMTVLDRNPSVSGRFYRIRIPAL